MEDSNSTTAVSTGLPSEAAIVIPIVISIIDLIGLVGNCLVVGAVIRYKAMRSAPNLFIVNIAIGDIILNLVSFPVGGLMYTIEGWPYGAAFCKIAHFLITLTLGMSIFTMTALSIDRVLVITQTLKLWQKASTRIIVMIVAVWICSILAALPDMISYNLVTFPDENNGTFDICRTAPADWDTNFNYSKIYFTVYFTVYFCVPFIIISVCYGVMAYKMVESSRQLPGESSGNSSWKLKQIRMRRKVANIMIALIVLFFVCWLPRSVLIMYRYHGNFQFNMSFIYAQMTAIVLMAANGMVNPIALLFLSKSFKTHFKKQICCGKDSADSADNDLGTMPDSHPRSRLLKSTHQSHLGEDTELTSLDHH